MAAINLPISTTTATAAPSSSSLSSSSSSSSSSSTIFPKLSPPNSTINSLSFSNKIPHLLQLSLQTKNNKLAMSIHTSLIKNLQTNNPKHTYFFNTLILTYFKLGLSFHAYKVFNSLQYPDVVTFTSIISWLSKSKFDHDVDKAVNFFFQMRDLGIELNEYSFVAILTVCGRFSDLQFGLQVHCLAVKLGFVDDSFVGNALMGFYCRFHGCLDCVVKVFDEMSQRGSTNISSWNTVISCFIKECMYDKALELFHDLLVGTDGVEVDGFTLSTVLTACTEHGAINEGFGVHACAVKYGLVDDNLSVGNALIGFYSKCGNVKDVVRLFDRMVNKDVITWTQMISAYMESGLVEMAEEVFDKMPERNCVSYNTLLQGFCQKGYASKALRMFCIMVNEGVELDDFSLSIVINACGLLADKSTSEQIHGFVLKCGYGLNDRIESALIDMCTKCGRIDDAEELFNSHSLTQNSSIIWTSMICGYARHGLPFEALSLFFKGQGENFIAIDEVVSTAVLGVCATLGFDQIGQQIHSNAIKLDLLHDIKVGNALIGMYSKCGNMIAAIRVFDSMKRHDIVSWNSLLACYIFHKQGDNALDLWEKMKKKNIKPDSITTLLIISAYTHTKLNMVNECYAFFQYMKTSYNIGPDSNHYASLVNVFGKWGLLEEAYDIIKNMPYEPDPFVWKALLDQCRTHMNTVIGKKAAKEILAKKPNDPSTYILVSNLYSASGRWHCSETVREEMREKGIQKRPGKSWIIHENKVHSFYARDKSHARFKDIYSGLDILVMECLKIGYVPDTNFVLHEVEEHQKRDFLYYHSAKLAVTYGLLMTNGRMPVRVMKNILLCGDCHSFFKYVSIVTKREIHIRDASGFHCFANGECTCKA
ncbi:pentatricopeptide repeat-containing protein At5g03800-like isoform X2 [Rutidosis leptorrhynchoides]|uniref:pentatricopeptide repeat-containing protein At5g03800-like isoform X2 n=1 Tax=Rutidosis leptorrhynchoides TaxID=125765 RepID=UPI003A99ACC7